MKPSSPEYQYERLRRGLAAAPRRVLIEVLLVSRQQVKDSDDPMLAEIWKAINSLVLLQVSQGLLSTAPLDDVKEGDAYEA
jgi:hypothetical protein